MPAPANANELLELIQKSGVVDEAKLRGYVQKLKDTSSFPPDPAKFAGLLVRDAVLTYFQAEQLLQGKFKRFSIGKYKVLEKLGAGGMAQVFLCEHKLMRRRVAIKVLPTAKADDPSSLERFRREAAIIAAVDHPNIVRAYDIDQDDNLHFLVMEYVDGTNLQDLVKKFGPLDILRACHYIYGAAVGLQHAHEKGLVHRDIKPGNILIDRSGVVKILDMGLARFFHDEEDALTKKYDENVLGTADYLAPEQALDSHTVDIRADIYSLGATFYFLVTGSALFPEGSVAQKLIWHQSRQPKPVRALRPEMPEELAAIVDRMTAKDAAKRFQTPAEILVTLMPWVSTPIPPPSDRELPQISPAAGGSARVGPLKGADSSRITITDAPTIVASNPLTPPQPFPLPGGFPAGPALATSPHQAEAQPAVWESLDSETQTVAKGDTDPVNKPKTEPRSSKSVKGRQEGRGPILFILLGGALFLFMAAGGVYFAFFNKKAPPPPQTTSSHTITVTNETGENNVPRLRDALARVGPGDTIVIMVPELTESVLALVRTKHKDVTIESGLPDGKAPVIRFSAPKSGADTRAFLSVDSVEGFCLRNIEFDGKNGIQTGILISGSCPGAVLENVTVSNVRYGVTLSLAAGEAGRPIVLDRLRTHSIGGSGTPSLEAGCGLQFTTGTANVDTKYVEVRNCRFEGPCKDGIRVEGPATELGITGNRFFNLDTALSLNPHEKTGKAIQVVSNTVCQAKAGILLDVSPPIPPDKQPSLNPGKFEGLTIAKNYFADSAEVGKLIGSNDVPGMTAKDNAKGPNCGDGNLGIKPTQTNAQVGSKDPANDSKFLRFDGGPPALPGGTVRAGAP